MLLARHERAYPETEENIRKARKTRIEFLEKVAWSSQCSGVARYELAHLYDLTGNHVKALELHANNREQYPRFYRGRYRLAMSLEMIASPYPETRISEDGRDTFNTVLRILGRWDGAQDDKSHQYHAKNGKLVLTGDLRSYLLGAAQQELHDIGRYLTLWDVIWQSFWHRNERGVLKPYWRWRHRQSYHDGVCLAQLLVAVRQTLNGNKAHLSHHRKVLRIATAIAGDSRCIANLLDIPYKAPKWSARMDPPRPGQENLPQMVKRWGREEPPKMDKRLRTRWPWRYSTPSWPAAYNLACVYAAIRADPGRLEARMKEIGRGRALQHPKRIKDMLETLVEKVVTSLEFAIINPDCEMERPSEWIEHDPDFACLRSPGHAFSKFMDFLFIQKQRDYPSNRRRHRIMGNGSRPSILPERSDVV
jgi:hypothetical protein